MGFTHSCVIAQAVSMTLLWLASKRCPLNDGEKTDVYIDNLAIVGKDKAHLVRFRSAFIDVCKEFNVTIGEISEVGTQFVHRGVELYNI